MNDVSFALQRFLLHFPMRYTEQVALLQPVLGRVMSRSATGCHVRLVDQPARIVSVPFTNGAATWQARPGQLVTVDLNGPELIWTWEQNDLVERLEEALDALNTARVAYQGA